MRNITRLFLSLLVAVTRPGFAQPVATSPAQPVATSPAQPVATSPAQPVATSPITATEHPELSVAPTPTATTDLRLPGPPAFTTTQPQLVNPSPYTGAYPPLPPGYVYVAVPATAAPSLQQKRDDPPCHCWQKKKRVDTESRNALGVAPLVLANVHWLDKPGHRKVTVENVHGEDRTYPGFVGGDLALGLMLDFRIWYYVGIEVDLIYQNDRGKGTVIVKDHGSFCYLPNGLGGTSSDKYEVEIGQHAWHVPVMAKWSIPWSFYTIEEEDRVRVFPVGFTSLAFGPEFVIPEDASLQVDRSGLSHPLRATASSYVMYTGSLGLERRLIKSIDLRLIASLRGSFNPGPKNSVARRGEYVLANGEVTPLSYKSEWRFQAGATLGLGWFF